MCKVKQDSELPSTILTWCGKREVRQRLFFLFDRTYTAPQSLGESRQRECILPQRHYLSQYAIASLSFSVIDSRMTANDSLSAVNSLHSTFSIFFILRRYCRFPSATIQLPIDRTREPVNGLL